MNVNNYGFVGAIFRLSGIILYFTALMYQIKEYTLQVVELEKSVQAQTKSSTHLTSKKDCCLNKIRIPYIWYD